MKRTTDHAYIESPPHFHSSLLAAHPSQRADAQDVLVVRYDRPFSIEVVFRVDGRSGDHWRVDLANYTTLIWEAIDGGRDSAPRTLAAAKKLAGTYFRAAIAQGTLHPTGF
jgi:hypothetical protein